MARPKIYEHQDMLGQRVFPGDLVAVAVSTSHGGEQRILEVECFYAVNPKGELYIEEPAVYRNINTGELTYWPSNDIRNQRYPAEIPRPELYQPVQDAAAGAVDELVAIHSPRVTGVEVDHAGNRGKRVTLKTAAMVKLNLTMADYD